MVQRILKLAHSSLFRGGRRDLPAANDCPSDFTPAEQQLWRSVQPFTMTSKERVVSLIRAVEHLERFRVPGAFVECGVWRGGSMMAVARTLLLAGRPARDLYLFDTFSGMPQPTGADMDAAGRPADRILAESRTRPLVEQHDNHVIARCSLDVVRSNVLSTGYPAGRLHFIEGTVEQTIPDRSPDQIALLRLDTDWYESTRHELIHLFPRLSRGGILIIDDYGHWQGARKAVDEYFEELGEPIFLSRIDYTGRIAVRSS